MTAQCAMQFSSRGVRPGITTVLARHLDKNTMGYLQWRWGAQSSMNTSIVRDTKSSHFTFAVQVSNLLKPTTEECLSSKPALFQKSVQYSTAVFLSILLNCGPYHDIQSVFSHLLYSAVFCEWLPVSLWFYSNTLSYPVQWCRFRI